jgi:hypothetical protein
MRNVKLQHKWGHNKERGCVNFLVTKAASTKVPTKSRPRTYPFFEDIYPILYHGQKSDIISYPISRQKHEKGYIYKFAHFYVLSAHYMALLRAILWAEST